MGSEMAALGPPRRVRIADLRRLAQRRLPRPVFDYLDGGADDETTLRENPRAFNDILFRPRNAVAFDKCDLSVRVLGLDLAFPGLLAPVGYSRLMHPGGEVPPPKAPADAATASPPPTLPAPNLKNVKP